MSIIVDALQPRVVRALFSLSGRPSIQHVSDTITKAPQAGYDLDVDELSHEIRVDFREASFISEAFGGDASRLASACFTSMADLIPALERADSLPWALIRLYYSSFYAGHSVMRLLGHSCTYFEGRQTGLIKALLAARGSPVAFDLPSGLYKCSVNVGQTGFTMTFARGRVGGAHEIFWEVFDAILSGLTEEILRGQLLDRDAKAVFSKVEALRRIYRRGVGASWLSSVRNEIQYRQGFGVWNPVKVNRSRRESLARLAGQWTRDPMEIDVDAPPAGDLSAFIIACVFTAALCRTLLTRVADRSSVPAKSFARLPLQLC
ncbi:hypothetical protein [Jiella sp. M17.18]|uniref:hypothetical protein n=1 Tax=Jiella sp. M17.18 TaxID=3234247 RepID=UPI0034DE0F51